MDNFMEFYIKKVYNIIALVSSDAVIFLTKFAFYVIRFNYAEFNLNSN